MTQRPKLELELNKPVTIEKLYTDCVSGNNNFGAYYLYAVRSEGKEYSYFAPDTVHEAIKDVPKGDLIIITKQASQKNGKVVITYDVQRAVKETVAAGKPIDEEPLASIVKQDALSVTHDIKDSLYYTMIRCYRQAIAIQQELGGMIDVEKAAVTLFIATSKGTAGVNVPGR